MLTIIANKHTNMEKEIKLLWPESLADINIAVAMVYMKVMKLELEPMEKVTQLLASMNDLDINDVRKIPIGEIDKVGVHILKLFQEESSVKMEPEEFRIISIDGVSYGLEPNFNKIETGAYIDLSELLSDIEGNLHKIMAIIYRPVDELMYGGYILHSYVEEADDLVNKRAEMFLKKMPYNVVRASVNFFKSLMVN